jgi:hypothetical protein
MCLGVNRNSTNRIVTVRTCGNHHRAICPQKLPSFKRPRCTIDLIYRHAEFNAIAHILQGWGTRALNAKHRCTDRIDSDRRYSQLQRSNQNSPDYLESRHCIRANLPRQLVKNRA